MLNYTVVFTFPICCLKTAERIPIQYTEIYVFEKVVAVFFCSKVVAGKVLTWRKFDGLPCFLFGLF